MARHNPGGTRPLTTMLALDCGSTTFKGALFHASRGCVADAGVPVPYLDRTGAIDSLATVEMDPEALWQTTLDLILTLCRQAGLSPAAIDRIALTSQAQTFALLDGDDHPLTPFISWLDERGKDTLSEVVDRLGDGFHAHCSFAPPLAQLQLAKVLWLRRHRPALLDRARRVIALPSYLTLRLAGLDVLDPNIAAMGGLYSLHRANWWPEALALCGITPAQLSELVPLGHPVPARRFCAELPLPEDLTVVFAGNDQTGGAVGNGCAPGEVVVTLGTALVAYHTTGETPGPYSPTGCWGPYPGGGYYELAVVSHGCLALDWAREHLLPGQPVTDFTALAARALDEPSDPVLFHPARMGTATAWVGQGSPAQRALAVLEGIGFTLRRLIVDDLGLNPHASHKPCTLENGAPGAGVVSAAALAGLQTVTAVGGGSRSDLWLQLLADILNCPVRRGTGDARTGAALLATADVAGFEPPALPGIGSATIFHPDPTRVDHYRALYARWCDQQRRS